MNIPRVTLQSLSTGEYHVSPDSGCLVTFDHTGRFIKAETWLPLRDGRGPWGVYVNGERVLLFEATFEAVGDGSHVAYMNKNPYPFRKIAMWNKQKQDQLDKLKAEVRVLEGEYIAVRNSRVDDVCNIIGGGITAEELYEYRKELYDLFDRWEREEKQ